MRVFTQTKRYNNSECISRFLIFDPRKFYHTSHHTRDSHVKIIAHNNRLKVQSTVYVEMVLFNMSRNTNTVHVAFHTRRQRQGPIKTSCKQLNDESVHRDMDKISPNYTAHMNRHIEIAFITIVGHQSLIQPSKMCDPNKYYKYTVQRRNEHTVPQTNSPKNATRFD